MKGLIVLLSNRYANENVNKLLVGNKSDLVSKRAVTFEQGQVCVLANTDIVYVNIKS